MDLLSIAILLQLKCVNFYCPVNRAQARAAFMGFVLGGERKTKKKEILPFFVFCFSVFVFFFMFALSQFSGPDYPGAWNRLSQTQYVSTCFYIILHLLILRIVAFYRVYMGKKWGKYGLILAYRVAKN